MRRRRWTDRFAWSLRLHIVLRTLNDWWHYVTVWFWEPEPTREEAIERALADLPQREQLLARRRKLRESQLDEESCA